MFQTVCCGWSRRQHNILPNGVGPLVLPGHDVYGGQETERFGTQGILFTARPSLFNNRANRTKFLPTFQFLDGAQANHPNVWRYIIGSNSTICEYLYLLHCYVLNIDEN